MGYGIEHCKKIGNVLAHIHSLDYKEIGLEPNVFEYKKLYDKYLDRTLDLNIAKRCCNFKLLEDKCKEYNKR